MSNLLEKASIIQVPAGYNVGSINAVKPNLDLSEELVVNGDFATNSDWFLGDGWSISNGKATSTIGNNNHTLRKLYNIGISGGKTYRVKFDVLDYVSGTFRVFLGNNGDNASKVVEGITENGSYSYDFTSPFGTNGLLIFRNASTDTSFSIDNVSVKEILPADLYFDRGTGGSVQSRVKGNQTIVFPQIETPRLDYTGGTGHWLIEPTSTNTATYSNDFTQGSIFVGGGTPQPQNLLILSSSQGVSPDGTNNSWKIQVGSTNNVLHHLRFTNAIVTSGVVNTLSVFAKKGENVDYFGIFCDGLDANYRAWFDLENGTKGTLQNGLSSKMEDYGNGWYRCSISFQTTTSTVGNLRFVLAKTDGGENFIGGTNEYHYIYGVQGEVNAFPTSYIPTSGGTATRDTEVASGSGDSTTFNDSEGVLYLETASLVSLDSSFRTISICDGTNDDTLRIRYSTIENRIDVLTRSGGVTKVDMNYTVTDITDFNKIALKYKSGDSALWVDGVERATSTVTFAHSGLNELKLSQGDANAPFYGKIKCIAVFKEALSDSELQCLTT